MAGWIHSPLGTEVDLGPGDIVLHGDPAPSQNMKYVSVPFNYSKHSSAIDRSAQYVLPRIVVASGLGRSDRPGG